jgi:ABC-type uncharacterized transport system substrate-binding protein
MPTRGSEQEPLCDQILRSAKAGNLPIGQPTQFNLVINLKTASVLGLTILESVLAKPGSGRIEDLMAAGGDLLSYNFA